MRGSPVEKNADACLVAPVDKFHELRGRAEAAGRREVTEGLVAPGAVVGMLHDRKKLDMRVAEFFDVGNQPVGEFAVSEPAVALVWNASPGAEMNFVDTDRQVEPIGLRAVDHPVAIGPGVLVQAGDHGTVVGAQLRAESVRVGFQRQDMAVLAEDFVFVDGTFAELGKKQLPNSGRAAETHWADAAIPTIEIADHTDAASSRSPNSELDATNIVNGSNMGAQFFVGIVMPAFAHEIQIKFG